MTIRVGVVLAALAVQQLPHYVVIPLSATTRGAFAWPVFINGLAIHMFGVGLPAAWFAARR